MQYQDMARKAFLDLLSVLSKKDTDRVDQLSGFLHSRCNGFGTAIQEIFRSREEWLSLFREETIQIPGGLTIQSKWCETFPISDGVVGLLAETIFEAHLLKYTIRFDPVRMSLIYKLEGNKMLVTHWHNSHPFGESNDEIFPGSKEPRRYEEVSVLFTDFVGFTNTVAGLPAKELVDELNELFSSFDEITEANGLTKIKTIGDAYMAISGLKEKDAYHAIRAVQTAKDFLRYLEHRNASSKLKWNIRAGIHSGNVLGGVIGRDKLQFDVWGDTVNVASRLESAGESGKINVSEDAYTLIKEKFPCEYRGKIGVKGKGEMEMYFVK